MWWGSAGALVLDAHGECHRGLSGHPRAASKLVCHSASPAAGHLRLAVNIRSMTPHHFRGLVEFREPQERMMRDLWGACRKEWIVRLFDESGDEDVPEPQKMTRTVLRQKVRTALGIRTGGTFETGDGGESTIYDIVRGVSEGRVVVLDASGLGTTVGMMVASMAASRLLWSYQAASDRGELDGRPVATVTMEEAPACWGPAGWATATHSQP